MLAEAGVIWQVVVPVKATPNAKSRLAAEPNRAALAEAFALDTVAALVSAPTIERVFVVTTSSRLSARLAALGAIIVIETQADGQAELQHNAVDDTTRHARLNAAIELGIQAARHTRPQANIMVMLGDLPALRPTDLAAACELAAGQRRSMVPDADGTGTTSLFARAGLSLRPRFGVGSRAKHETDGHVVLGLPHNSSLRRDVDTSVDLAAARALGVGPHTSALLSDG